MRHKTIKPPQLSRPGLRGRAHIPRTWEECIHKALKIARIEHRRIEREGRDPWARKIRSLLIGWRYGQRVLRVPRKDPADSAKPPLDWQQCIRRQRQKIKSTQQRTRLSPWDRTIRRKVVSLCIKSRLSQWRTPMNVTQQELRRQLDRQDYRCALTGRPLSPQTATIDHCVPLNRGGRHEIENLRFVHVDVNRAKGTLTVEEFVALCSEVVRHRPGTGVAEAQPPVPRTWDQWAEQQIETIHKQNQQEPNHV